MAEMTASEAIELLKRQWEHLFSLNQDQIDGMMKFIEQQQQQIEAQAKQIELACSKLTKFRKCPPVVCDLSYHPGDAECVKHWHKWLEQQVKEEQ